MKLATIQSKEVLNILSNWEIYKSDFNKIFDDIDTNYSSKMQAYQILMKHYGYKTAPIFCCVVDRRSNFYDFRKSNDILLELNVPDELVNLHLIYYWMDILFYTAKGQWNEDKYKRYKNYLDGINADDMKADVQAVIPFIQPEWVIGAYKIDKDFVKECIKSNMLESKSYAHNQIYRNYVSM